MKNQEYYGLWEKTVLVYFMLTEKNKLLGNGEMRR
jgi:hypothetical protein